MAKRVIVKVKPKSKQQKVVVKNDGLLVCLNSSPQKGKANKELVKVIAKHLKISPSKVAIASGFRSRKKIIEGCS